MPEVPRLTSPQVAQAPLQIAGRTPGPAFLNPLGQGLQNFGIVREQLRQHELKLQASAATTAAASEIDRFQLGLESDVDFQTQPERYQAFVEQLYSDLSGGLEPDAVARFQSDFGALAQRTGIDVERNALRGMNAVRRASIDEQLEILSGLAGSGDDEYDSFLLNQGMDTLADGYEAGLYAPEDLQARSSRYRSQIETTRVRRSILDDPEGAEQALLSDGFPNLDGEDRLVWTERAQAAADSARRERIAEEDRRLREVERLEKELAEAAERDGLELQRSGELSAAWIEQNRDILTPAAQKYFYRALNGEEGTTDVRTYTDLRERAGRGEDVTADTRLALYAGRIKREDYDRVLGVVDREGQTGWYRRGESFITNSLRPSDTNPDPAAPQRYALAMDDWYQWASDNPDAGDTEARAAYQQLVKDYRLVEANLVTLEGPRPTYLVGSRTQPDLDATERATVEAFERGDIDESQLNRQAEILQQWRNAVENQNGSP